jgi:hypothetical protein
MALEEQMEGAGGFIPLNESEYVAAFRPVVKVRIGEIHPSGAKARRFLSSICGTTKVVPFQNMTSTTGC